MEQKIQNIRPYTTQVFFSISSPPAYRASLRLRQDVLRLGNVCKDSQHVHLLLHGRRRAQQRRPVAAEAVRNGGVECRRQQVEVALFLAGDDVLQFLGKYLWAVRRWAGGWQGNRWAGRNRKTEGVAPPYLELLKSTGNLLLANLAEGHLIARHDGM